MEIVAKTVGALKEAVSPIVQGENASAASPLTSPQGQQPQQQQPQLKTKRKHRRGKPKAKNVNKPYKKTNWKFQVPRYNYNYNSGSGVSNNRARAKLMRSRSLVPYNTNKFLMEEHLAEIPSALLTPSGRTRDSSFSVDSEDNYFFSLPEDEEEFLTKEFANVYEKARVERLENLTKQELIEECLQIEDRYSTDQGAQRKQQLNVQRISAEFMSKIRMLEEKVKELSRENYNLRCQLMRSAAAAGASPPSAAAPIGAACGPTPMDSSSEDSESDSSSSSSSSSAAGEGGGGGRHANERARRRRSCSSRSSLSEHNGHIDNYLPASVENDINEEEGAVDEFEQAPLLEAQMEEDADSVASPQFVPINADIERGTSPPTLGSPTSRLELENSSARCGADPATFGSVCN